MQGIGCFVFEESYRPIVLLFREKIKSLRWISLRLFEKSTKLSFIVQSFISFKCLLSKYFNTQSTFSFVSNNAPV